MAASFIQVPTDSTGKKLRTFERVVGADTVHEEFITLVDAAGNQLAIVNTAPATTEYGLVTREALSNRKATATLASAASLAIDCQGMSSVTFEIDGGTLVGTVVFEGLIDDVTPGTWFAISAVLVANSIVNVTSVSKASGTAQRGSFVVPPAGYAQVRIRVSAYTSGSSAARLTASTAPSPFVGLLPSTNSQTVAIAANALILARMQKSTDVTSWANTRVPNVFTPLNAVAVGTAAAIWTPTAGKKFRLMGYHLSGSVAGNYLLNDGAAGPLIDVVPLAAGGPGIFVSLGDLGKVAAVTDNVLECVGPANPSALSGVLFGCEE